MRRLIPRISLVTGLLMALLWGAATGLAQTVEVTSARFTNLRAPNGAPGSWFEANLVLNARPEPGARGQMVPRVRVALLICFELPGPVGGERRLEYYRAEAECVALEPGRADVRFYLPPEIVKRDQLHGDPKYWGVELTAEGKPVPAAKGAYSTTLSTSDMRKNFQKRAATGAASNDGLLLPQYLTPFVNEYPRATPSFVRKELR